MARRFAYVGTRLKEDAWPAGTYTGTITLTRAGEGQAVSREVKRTVIVG